MGTSWWCHLEFIMAGMHISLRVSPMAKVKSIWRRWTETPSPNWRRLIFGQIYILVEQIFSFSIFKACIFVRAYGAWLTYNTEFDIEINVLNKVISCIGCKYQSHVSVEITHIGQIRVIGLREILENQGISKSRFQIRENQKKSSFLEKFRKFHCEIRENIWGFRQARPSYQTTLVPSKRHSRRIQNFIFR